MDQRGGSSSGVAGLRRTTQKDDACPRTSAGRQIQQAEGRQQRVWIRHYGHRVSKAHTRTFKSNVQCLNVKIKCIHVNNSNV